MTITQVLQFQAPSSKKANAEAANALEGLKEAKKPQNFTIGTHIKDKSTVSIASEWHDPKEQASPEASAYTDAIRNTLGSPSKMFHVAFKKEGSAFGPISAPVVEFVQTRFPSKKVTSEFRQKIEQDFEKFEDATFNKGDGIDGHNGVCYGWVLEEQDFDDVEGGKAKCFFVARGWKNMGCFDEFMGSETFKKNIGTLLAWKADYDMWHVKRQDQIGQ
jgi:hypothetical protein